jgi:predicted nucleic acid-binding protein
MTPMSSPLSAFTGSTLYLDTMAFYIFLRDPGPVVCNLFTRIADGQLQARTSVLTFDELTYKMLLALIRDNYGGSPLDHLRDREPELIAEFYPVLAPLLSHLRLFPNLLLIDVTSSDLESMDEAMRLYHLRPRDALHLAAMGKCGCCDLLSHDADFDRVPTVHRYTL